MPTALLEPTLSANLEPAPEPLRVLIADDHPLFRRGLRLVLESRREIAVVGEADNGADAMLMIDLLEPDVAVLDLRMPELDGIEVCAALRSRPGIRPTRLLLLSAFEDADLVWAAFGAGADGYVGKSAGPDAVVAAVLSVACGGIDGGESARSRSTGRAEAPE